MFLKEGLLILGIKMDESDAFLIKIEKSFLEKDSYELRRMSLDLLEEAVAVNSKKIAKMAVIAYALHKLTGKVHMRGHADYSKFESQVSSLLTSRNLDSLIGYLKKTDEMLGHYRLNVMEKARAKLASKAYDFGISISSACDLFDVEPNKILQYSGETTEKMLSSTKELSTRWKSIKRILGDNSG
jgi:hypothetical protein